MHLAHSLCGVRESARERQRACAKGGGGGGGGGERERQTERENEREIGDGAELKGGRRSSAIKLNGVVPQIECAVK